MWIDLRQAKRFGGGGDNAMGADNQQGRSRVLRETLRDCTPDS